MDTQLSVVSKTDSPGQCEEWRLSPKLPVVTAVALQRAIERDGWRLLRQRGSHRVFVHQVKAGLAVIPAHKGQNLPTGLVARILKDAGLTPDDLRELL